MLMRYYSTPSLLAWDDPFALGGGFRRSLDDLFQTLDRAWRPMGPAMIHGLDIVEQDDAYLVSADVPGCGPDDVEVDVQDRRVTITAQRRAPQHEGFTPRLLERKHERLSWSSLLSSAVDANAASASLKDGRLELRIPKAPEAKPRSIAVKTH